MTNDQIWNNDLTQYEYYMSECFELAKKALGRTSPNPIVGAIVLDKNGLVVGKGFHNKAGTEHAEVIAIKEAKEKSVDGTLIVNLEPCCHFGKTPPCTNLILNSKIKRVIFSNFDPNPEVNKKSKQVLSDNGIQVISGILEDQGLELNKFFFKWIKTKTPWIMLKQAQTLDGKVALKDSNEKWISNNLSRTEVHKLRDKYDAVMVGAKTVLADNPKLTVREVDVDLGIRDPARVILDANLITPPESNVYDKKSDAVVYLVTKKDQQVNKMNEYLKVNKNLQIIQVDQTEEGKLDLVKVFLELGKNKMLSVLVESGPTLASELILKRLIDEYLLFIAPKIFGNDGIKALNLDGFDNKTEFKVFEYKIIGNDLMVSLRP